MLLHLRLHLLSSKSIMTYEDLLNVLRKYDVALDPHAIASAFDDEDQGTVLAEWTKSHLTEDTLITKDELNSYVLLC